MAVKDGRLLEEQLGRGPFARFETRIELWGKMLHFTGNRQIIKKTRNKKNKKQNKKQNKNIGKNNKQNKKQ